ncbi:MAG: Ig-like domain-containing protein [Tetrasphaera sp.]
MKAGTQHRGAVLLTVVVLAVGILAAFHRGVPVADLRLNDGGVWVTNLTDGLVAHLNYPSRTLDSGLRVSAGDFDITQAGNSIVLHDTEHAQAQPVDPAFAILGTALKIPEGMRLVHGGSTALVVDSGGGRIWALDAGKLNAFSPEADPTVAKVKGVKAVVGLDGVGRLVTPDGAVRRITAQQDGWQTADDGELKDYQDSQSVVLSAVGDQVVAVDTVKRVVWSHHGREALDAGEVVTVQQPGENSDSVTLATANALLRVPLSGGDVAELPAGGAGRAAAPVVVAGCAYAAWSGSGAYVRDCPGTADDVTKTGLAFDDTDDLVFRVNRNVVVLNNVANGDIYLVNDEMQLVDNWTDITNQAKERSDKENNASQEVPQTAAAKRDKNNHPPIAEDDEFGVRPGRSTTLPVLINDADPDGDVLTATVAKSPSLGSIRQVRGGEALQIEVPDKASGRAIIAYTVSDGRGGEATGRATISVHPWSQNEAPKPLRASKVVIDRKGEIRYNILPDWIDPDGDAVTLASASAPPGLQVRSRADGPITVRDLGTTAAGVKDVALTVSDGKKQSEGTLSVDVKSAGNIQPIANPDHVRVFKNRQIVVDPLANDIDANADPLRLVQVSRPASGSTVTTNLSTGRFTFSSTTIGTQYLDYRITDGPSVADGIVRIDVVDRPKDHTPVADGDLALLPSGGSVLVDVLANDYDPLGGVLVVQIVTVPTNSPLAVEVIDHGLLRISAPGGLPQQTTFAYTMSNGEASAKGQVTVVPIPPKANPEPPVAVDDPGLVRAGDVVTVPVKENDSSPSGLTIHVDPAIDIVTGGDLGTFFVSNDTVRFKAGGDAGRARATYTIRDDRGNFASADVAITIRALDGKNAPPAPKPLVARVLAGNTVSIRVPTDGIDPDGDSALLVGLGKPPTKGTARVAAGRIEYSAPADASGTDTFSYAVADRFGARGTATVQVGIAPPPPVNQAPVAVPDTITARPETELAIPVTVNDFDGDGDPITLTQGAVTPVSSQTTTTATAAGSRAELVTPKKEGTLQYYYAITDGRGGASRGVLTVTVTPTAPLQPPVARDDIVDPSDVVGRQSVTVAVLDNDEDPDGTVANLKVSTSDDRVDVDGKDRLVIPVTDERQVLVYTVTDPDKQAASAVVVVPAASGAPPALRTDKIPVAITAGETIVLPLADYVRVRDGHSPQITYEKTVRASAGSDGSPLVKDSKTLTFTAPADFAGQSSVTFEVTDGKSPDDPAGLTSVLTIPIDVTGKGNTQPVFQPSEVTVAAGEEASTVDLKPMVTDPDPGDLDKLRFSLGSTPAGFDISLDGSTLSVSAPADTEPNTGALIPVEVTDGSTDPVRAQLPLTVLASTRPLMTTRDAVINDANAGEARDVDVADYVTNPFADQNKPITLVGRPAVVAGEGSVTAAGTNLTITPKAGSHGELTVSYRVADATQSADRQVEGRVLLTVRGAPDPPTGVTAETNASKTATVSWTAGANNGAPITGFTVTWSGGSQKCKVVTTCTITGLTNNTVYRFQVVATNDVGDSKPSAASNEVRPDEKPNPPGPPSATAGDKQIALTWPRATTEGSPVREYVLSISPPPGGQGEINVGAATAYTLSSLTNGTPYVVKVKAIAGTTDEPLESDWSAESAPTTPFGRPVGMTAPRATMNPDKTLPPSATISWDAADGNGDDSLTYEVRNNATGQVTSAGSSREVTLAVPVGEQSLTFAVQATNSAGPSGWSPASNAVRAFKAPGTPTNVSARPTGTNNQVQISFTPGATNGALPSEISYLWSAGGAGGSLPSGGGTITDAAFPNGQNVAVSVRARAVVDGVQADSLPSGGVVVNAYGPPNMPSVSASGNVTDVKLSWNGSGAGNGRAISAVRINTTDGGDQVVSVTGSKQEGNGRNQTKAIRAQAQDSEGNWGPWSGTQQASTWDVPYEVTNHGDSFTCSYTDCKHVYVELHRWNPGTTVRCFVAGSGAANWTSYRTVDGNGYAPPSSEGSPAALFDSAGDRIGDGVNTVECTQQ